MHERGTVAPLPGGWQWWLGGSSTVEQLLLPRRLVVTSVAAVVVPIVLVCAIKLLEPITGDQALQIEIARRIRDGEVLYRDVWDIRQPFNVWWYVSVGSLFGDGEVGIRLGEMLWFAVLGGLVSYDTLRRTGDRRQAIVTGLVSTGTIVALLRPNDVAAPETLVLLPLYLGYRTVARREGLELRTADLFVLGVIAGVVAMFKLPYAPIVLGFVLVHMVMARTDRRWRDARLVRSALAVLGGFLVVVAPVIVYFAAHDTLRWTLQTWFEFGPAMRRNSPPPFGRLVRSVGSLVVTAVPLLAVAVVVDAFRSRARLRQMPAVLAIAWLVIGLPAVLVQQWWAYQLLLLVFPLGLLAAPAVTELSRASRAVGIAVVTIGLVLVAVGSRKLTSAVLDHGLDREAIQHEMNPVYDARDQFTAFFAETERVPGTVYGMTDPTVLLDVDRADTISINGWSPEFYDEAVWQRLARELEDERPAYVLVDGFSAVHVEDRASGITTLLQVEYREIVSPVAWIAVYELR